MIKFNKVYNFKIIMLITFIFIFEAIGHCVPDIAYKMSLRPPIGTNYERIASLYLEGTVKLVGDIFNNSPLVLNELVEDYSDRRDRLLTLYGKVAALARKISSKAFGIVLYPASGSDISAAIFYANRVVTIDNQDIFNVKPGPFFTVNVHKDRIVFDRKEILKDETKSYLEKKLMIGFHSSGIKQGFIEYLAELLLLGVDLDTLRILDDRFVNNDRVTTVEFIIRSVNGAERKILHTHIRHVFDSQPLPEHIRNELKAIIGERCYATIIITG